LKFRGELKIPVITSFYGYDVSQLARQSDWLKRYQTLFLEGDLFLVEGEFMKSRLIELGAPSDKVRIQRIAMPLDKLSYSVRRPIKNGGKVVFLFCGRFIEKKGLVFALRAMQKVHSSGKDFEFRIIGDGYLRPKIETFIQDNQMSKYVKLLGSMNYQNYLNEMCKANIYIHPSVTAEDGDTEGGAPTAILEAQAMGMPVLTTFHADIPNIVLPGESALLSNERDWQGLAYNISYLLENQDCWAKMGQSGRAFVEQYHDIKNELDNLETNYMSVIYH
jgi:colanic acid/amylovoran biosynthesis glycosyltransferase